MNNEMSKRFMFFSAVCNIVQIFGETELGSCEVDEDAVAEYCLSDRFVAHLWSCNTKEDIYEKLTEDILNGFPVWEFLKVSDWTKNVLEKSYMTEKTNQWLKLCKTYKCYTCKYYKACETDLGLYEECTFKEDLSTLSRAKRGKLKMRPRRVDFEPKKQCKNYRRIVNE